MIILNFTYFCQSDEESSLGVIMPTNSMYDAITSGTGTVSATIHQQHELHVLTDDTMDTKPENSNVDNNTNTHDEDEIDVEIENRLTKHRNSIEELIPAKNLVTTYVDIEDVTLDTSFTDSLTDTASVADTESVSTVEFQTLENTDVQNQRPLLQNYVDTDDGDLLYIDQNNGGLSAAYILSESDDTDSYSTPTDSPCKMRLDSLDLQPPKLRGDRKGGLYILPLYLFEALGMEKLFLRLVFFQF